MIWPSIFFHFVHFCAQIQSRFTDARKGTQELESSVKDLEMKMSEIEGMSDIPY